MKAVRISKHGGLDALTYDEIPEPNCPSDKVKICVKMCNNSHNSNLLLNAIIE